MEEDFDIQAALDEAKMTMADAADSIRSIKESAKTIFNAASIIIALFGVFQVFTAEVQAGNVKVFGVMLAIILLAYVILIGLCLYVLMPMKWWGPIDADWDEYAKIYFDKSHRDVLLVKLASYLEIIPMNDRLIVMRKYVVIAAGILFGLIVLLLSALSVILH